MSTVSPRASDRTVALALCLFLLSVYMLTYGGSLHSSDGQAMFSVTETLVRRFDYDINQIRWMGLQQGTYGPDGELYCRKGLGTSLVAIPLAWLGLVVPVWGVVQTTMLLNPIVTALTGMLLFLYVRRLGYRQSTGVVVALVFGLGTMAWPYAKYFFSEPLTGLALLGAAYFTLSPASQQRGERSWLPTLLAGLCLGLAMTTRFADIVLLPAYAAALAFRQLESRGLASWTAIKSRPSLLLSATWSRIIILAVPLVCWLALMASYNYARFGSPLTTGYLPEESFSAPWVVGILGLLVSPGRGILFFCPVLLAVLPALPSFFQRHRLNALLVSLTALSYILLYGKWFMWHGGFAWGPRFLVPILPLLCVTLAPLVDGLRGSRRTMFWALLGLSAAVQLLGLSVHFVHHHEAQLATGLPLFDPVSFFHPRYSQLWGTLAFLKLEYLDFAWIQPTAGVTIDWLALTVNLGLVVVAAATLLVVLRRTALTLSWRLCVLGLLPLLVVTGTALSLARYKNDGHPNYVDMLLFVQANEDSFDAIVQNSPPETALLQNHYKGRLASYGLFEGEQPLSADTVALLEVLAAEHRRVWLIPNGLPPHHSSLDRWFSERGWSPTHSSFGSERLTLYTRP